MVLEIFFCIFIIVIEIVKIEGKEQEFVSKEAYDKLPCSPSKSQISPSKSQIRPSKSQIRPSKSQIRLSISKTRIRRAKTLNIWQEKRKIHIETRRWAAKLV